MDVNRNYRRLIALIAGMLILGTVIEIFFSVKEGMEAVKEIRLNYQVCREEKNPSSFLQQISCAGGAVHQYAADVLGHRKGTVRQQTFRGVTAGVAILTFGWFVLAGLIKRSPWARLGVLSLALLGFAASVSLLAHLLMLDKNTLFPPQIISLVIFWNLVLCLLSFLWSAAVLWLTLSLPPPSSLPSSSLSASPPS